MVASIVSWFSFLIRSRLHLRPPTKDVAQLVVGAVSVLLMCAAYSRILGQAGR